MSKLAVLIRREGSNAVAVGTAGLGVAVAVPATAARVLPWDSSHKTPAIPRPPSTYDVHCVGPGDRVGLRVSALSAMISGLSSGSLGFDGCRIAALAPRSSTSSFSCFAFCAAAPLLPF